MKRLLLVLATGFGLDGCASLTQKADENYITKSPVTRSILPLMPLKYLNMEFLLSRILLICLNTQV